MRIARDIETARLHAQVLEELRLAGMGLPALPDDLPPMPALRVLDLSGNRLRHLPLWATELPALEALNLSGNQIDLIPAALQRMPRLRRLQIDQNPITGLPALPPTLAELYANQCPIGRFPESLLRCPSIQVIELRGCPIREWPGRWQLPPRILRLDLSQCQLPAFPHGLIAASQVDDLRLSGNPFLTGLGGDRFAAILSAFFQEAASRQMPLHDRACQLDILLEDPIRAGQHSSSRLLDALESPFAAVREKAPRFLTQILENPLRDAPPTHAVLAGRFSAFKPADAKKALAEAGCTVLSRLDQPGTLLIAGESPGRLLAEARKAHLPIALEGHLADWLQRRQGQYLASAPADHPMVSNLSTLLEDSQPANIEMALNLMGGGGIPPALLGRLLGLRLFHPDAGIRTKAATAWQPSASPGLREAVARVWREAQLEDERFDADLILRRLLPRPDIDAPALTRAALIRAGTGLRHIHHLPPSAQADLYALAIQRGGLNLRRLDLKAIPEGVLTLRQLPSLSLADNEIETLPAAIGQLSALQVLDLARNALSRIPDEVATLAQLISLDLSHNRIAEWPEACCAMPLLSALNLGHNRIATLPDGLPRLSALEYLGLRGLPMPEVPAVLGRMGQLRELDLGECGLQQIPESIGRLPLLQGLNLDKNPIATLPDWLGRMPRLRFLDLSHVAANRLPEGLAQAPRLERIYLLRDDSMDWVQVAEVLAAIPTLRHAYFKRNKIVVEMERHLERRIRQARVEFV